MKVISKAQEKVLKILGAPRSSDQGYRLLDFCLQTEVPQGLLLYNLLTCELLLLSDEERGSIEDLEYLRQNWFVVPREGDDRQFVELVRWVMGNTRRKQSEITAYTIFPTTDCNARCFYCYELGRSRVPMSRETALQTAAYIRSHCGGKKVRITWFGGEPLYNMDAIETICTQLQEDGVEFQSKMVSNAYLFDDDVVKKAVENWNLKFVQITLDGTEQVYNKCKAFIYKEGSPFRTVMANIGRLLDAGVRVSVRFNVDLHNGEDLLTLVDELSRQFSGKQGLSVYTHLLFDAELHGDDNFIAPRYESIRRIEERIAQCGLSPTAGVRKELPMNQCMADLDHAVTILPTGDIGRCEHFSEGEFIGHLTSEEIDRQVLERWKVRKPEQPECAHCFYYPHCIRLEKCPDDVPCRPYVRENHRRKTLRQMKNEYKKYLETEN